MELGTKAFSLKEGIGTQQFWLAFSIFMCLGGCVFSTVVHIVPHATDLGIPAVTAASMLTLIGGSSILGKVALSCYADKIGNRQILVIGFILMAAAFFWLMRAIEVWMLFTFAGVFGFAYGGCITTQSPLIAELFGLRSHGLILSLVGLGNAIGGAIGPFLAGYIFDAMGGYQVAFLIYGVTGITGSVLTLLLKPIASGHKEDTDHEVAR